MQYRHYYTQGERERERMTSMKVYNSDLYGVGRLGDIDNGDLLAIV